MNREPVIHPSARIEESVVIGDWSTIGENVVIYGDVEIGRDSWIVDDVVIGGGQKELGSLRTGDFFHLGKYSFINIASAVRIGHEVGMGMDTRLYTHGGYLSQLDGFPFARGPITVGSHVWLPNAMVLPNITIGSNVVVSAMSFVNRDLPDGCLAAGNPVKVIKENRYPRPVDGGTNAMILVGIAAEADNIFLRTSDGIIEVGRTLFMPDIGKIEGPANNDTERVKDILRRHGIRFRYYNKGGEYAEWD